MEENRNEFELIDITVLLGDMIRAVINYKVRFIAILMIVMIGYTGAKRVTYEPYYEAYKTYTINASIMTGSYATYLNNETADQMAKTFPHILKSDILRSVVKQDLGVDSIPGTISAEVLEGTNMLTLRVQARDGETAEKILQSVVKNYPAVAQYVIGSSQLELMDESGVPTVPGNPFNYKREAMIGLILGLGACFILVCIYAFTRNTIHNEEDIRKIFHAPYLGGLPRVKFKKSSKSDKELILIGNRKIPGRFLESTRTIRTRIERISREKGMKSFIVTSAMPGEGKSTVSANVALSLAAKGYEVILVDADLRNPSTAKVFGFTENRKGNGTLEVLTNQVSYQKALVPYKDTSVKLLLGSEPIADTASILSGETMQSFIQELEKRADYVIIDTPPSGLLSDAAIVGQYVKGTIFVIRQDYTWTDRIIEGADILKASGTQIIGTILNDDSNVKAKNGYGKSY